MKDKCIMCNTTNTDGCYSIQGQTVCKDCGKKYSLEEIKKMITKMNSKLTDKNKVNESRLGNNTFTDEDEAEYYRNKELYAHSGLARHREAMEKAKEACKEKGIDVDETKGVYESKQLNEEYSEELGGDPEDFVSDLKDILNKLNEIDTSDLGSHKAEEILSNLIDECNNKIKQVTSKYNLKESKTEEEPLNLQPDNTEIKQPKDLIGKYVKIGVNYYPVFDVKSEGDKFVICYGSAGPMVKGGEFEPATLDEIKNLQLYVNNKVTESKKDLTESLEDIKLNSTEVYAVEEALGLIKDENMSIDDAVYEAISTYNNGSAEPEYEDEDFYQEEADYDKVLAAVKQRLEKTKNITETSSKKVQEAKNTDVTLEDIADKAYNLGYEVDYDDDETLLVYKQDNEEDFDSVDNSELYSYLDTIPAVRYQIDNNDDSCLAIWLKSLNESKTLTESDNSDVNVDTDPIIYMNTWKNYNEYGADLELYNNIDGWMTVEDARNFAQEHEEDEPFINDTNVDLPFEVNEYSNVMNALDNIEEYLNLDEDDRDIIDCIMEVQTGDITKALDIFEQGDYTTLSDVSNEYDLGYEYVQNLGFPTNIMTYFDEDKYKESIRDSVYNMYLDYNNLQDVEDEEDFESYLDEIVQEDVNTFEVDVESNEDTIKEYFDYEYFGRDLTMSGWSICEDKNTAIYIN